MAKRYTAKFKFQVVMEVLTGERSAGQVAKVYGVHPNTVNAWKRTFLEKGAEVFAQDSMVAEYERRIADLERLLGKKEVEIALFEKLLGTGQMTPQQKVVLVESVKDTYGLNVALATVGLPKSTWYYHKKHKVDYEEKHAYLLPVLDEIARKHPEYGVPRIMPELREEYDLDVNHKVVERLLGIWDLSIVRSTHRPKPSSIRQAIIKAGKLANLVAQLEEIGPFQVLYTDFTELRYADGRRKAFLIPIIGHASKLAYGWAVGKHADTSLALQAWGQAKETCREFDIVYDGMIMHHDRDPVFTSYAWTARLLLDDAVRMSYALRGAKDNPEMESFNSRFKAEGHSLFLEAQTLIDLIAVVDMRMEYYNTERRHSSIGYLPPMTFIRQARVNLENRS